MEEEIDLRPYIELLIKRWYVILGVAILAGLIAFGVTSLQDPVYEATALIAVTQERLVARFDPRLDTTEERQPVDALPELATSDGFLTGLLEKINPRIDSIQSVADLRILLSAEPGDDPSLVRLKVLNNDPEVAARIANLWAEQFVLLSNDIYGDGGKEQVDFFEEQLTQAGEDLATTEAALVTFQGTNRQALLTNMVEAFDLSQDEYLAEQQELAQLKSNVEDLREQIAESNVTNTVSFADQLTALVLQLRAFNPGLELPIQLHLNGTSELSGTRREDQVGILEDLQDTIASRSSAVEHELAELEPQLLGFQEDLQQAQAEFNRLSLNRDIAQETYQSLARKVDEERITAEDMTRGIRLASEASVPNQPLESSIYFNVAIAVALALLAGLSIIFILQWWKAEERTPSE